MQSPTTEQLVARASLVGRARWVLGLFLVVGLLTPIRVLPAVVVVAVVAGVTARRRRRDEVEPLVRELTEVMSHDDVLELVTRARRTRGWVGPRAGLARTCAAVALRAATREDCRDGHELGCAHRPVRHWPSEVRALMRSLEPGVDEAVMRAAAGDEHPGRPERLERRDLR